MIRAQIAASGAAGTQDARRASDGANRPRGASRALRAVGAVFDVQSAVKSLINTSFPRSFPFNPVLCPANVRAAEYEALLQASLDRRLSAGEERRLRQLAFVRIQAAFNGPKLDPRRALPLDRNTVI
jgi:hypothetical protein